MSDLRQGVTEAGHDVFDMVDNLRALELPRSELNERAETMLSLKPGNAPGERLRAVTAAAYLIMIADDVDRELGA